MAKLAQSHGLNPNMVFKWRRQLRAGLLGSVLRREVTELLPISVVAEPGREVSVTTTVPTPQAIEIELNGARVRVVGMVDPTQLRLVLRCLMPA